MSKPICSKCGQPMRKNGWLEHPTSGEKRQRWRCPLGHSVVENPDLSTRYSRDPERRLPPPCPVVVNDKLCGLERTWHHPRAVCRVHGTRVLSRAELRALETGDPYPQRKVWTKALVRKVKR